MADPPRVSERLDLEPDVERLHRLIFREPHDPVEGRERVPWWLWAGAVLAIFWGGFYLGRYGGDFRLGIHQAYGRLEPVTEAAIAEVEIEHARDPIAHGRDVYRRICQACHQADGQGVPAAFPPLIGSRFVTGAEERLIALLLGGLAGSIEVRGVTYEGVMPAWGGQLADDEIAAVASFIRQWEENDAPPVTPERVAAVRARTADRTAAWTAEALLEAFP